MGIIWSCGVRRKRILGREDVNMTTKIERRKAYKQQFSLTKIKDLQVDIKIRKVDLDQINGDL